MMNTHIEGDAETIESLRGVKFGVGNRVLVAALRKQASKATKIAKGLVKGNRTGILKKSIGAIYRKPRRGNVGGGVFVVGPRKSFSGRIETPGQESAFTKYWKAKILRKTGQKLKRPKLSKSVIRKFKGLFIDPTKYAHLVEKGRSAVSVKGKKVLSNGEVTFGKSAKGVAARPFMRPASEAVKQSGPAEIAADVKAGIAREAAKYAAKGKSIYGATP
jgi:hypothetical protein